MSENSSHSDRPVAPLRPKLTEKDIDLINSVTSSIIAKKTIIETKSITDELMTAYESLGAVRFDATLTEDDEVTFSYHELAPGEDQEDTESVRTRLAKVAAESVAKQTPAWRDEVRMLAVGTLLDLQKADLAKQGDLTWDEHDCTSDKTVTHSTAGMTEVEVAQSTDARAPSSRHTRMNSDGLDGESTDKATNRSTEPETSESSPETQSLHLMFENLDVRAEQRSASESTQESRKQRTFEPSGEVQDAGDDSTKRVKSGDREE